MPNRAYAVIGFFALAFSLVGAWVTYHAWSLTNAYGKGAGTTATFAAFGAGIMFLSFGRNKRIEKIGETIFMIALAIFIVAICVGVVFPLVSKHF